MIFKVLVLFKAISDLREEILLLLFEVSGTSRPIIHFILHFLWQGHMVDHFSIQGANNHSE